MTLRLFYCGHESMDLFGKFSCFVVFYPGLVDTMKQGESANWSFNPEQFADLASSLSNFFNQATNSGTNPSGSTFDFTGIWVLFLFVMGCLFLPSVILLVPYGRSLRGL